MGNQVNLSNALTAQEQTDLLQQLTDVRVVLEKMGVNLTKEERMRARNVSDRRLSYVDAVLRAAKNYERVLPRDIDLVEYEKGLQEFIKMKDVFIKLEEIHELADDTIVSIGQLLMHYTDNVYNSLQIARDRDASLDNVMIQIEAHNKRTNTTETEVTSDTSEDTPTTTPPTTTA